MLPNGLPHVSRGFLKFSGNSRKTWMFSPSKFSASSLPSTSRPLPSLPTPLKHNIVNNVNNVQQRQSRLGQARPTRILTRAVRSLFLLDDERCRRHRSSSGLFLLAALSLAQQTRVFSRAVVLATYQYGKFDHVRDAYNQPKQRLARSLNITNHERTESYLAVSFFLSVSPSHPSSSLTTTNDAFGIVRRLFYFRSAILGLFTPQLRSTPTL